MILTTAHFLWLASLLAAAAYVWLGVCSQRPQTPNHRFVLASAWALHAMALFAGLYHSELRFGFAPALSMTAWIALSVYVIESRMFPDLRTHWGWALVGGATVVLAAIWPGASHLNVQYGMMAAHWVLGLTAYGLFVAAAIHAWLLKRSEKRLRAMQTGDSGAGLPVLTLERLMFQYVVAGFLFLTATLVFGGYYASGVAHAWRDHKIAFSLLAWVVIAVLLIGRVTLGWRGRKAARFIYAGTLLLLLAYVGSRFVLEVVLKR
jgi:ABC-type uncharacterized transport system permease subunit